MIKLIAWAVFAGLLSLLSGCGGSGDSPAAPVPHASPSLVGWWGAAQGDTDYLSVAAGNLGIFAPVSPTHTVELATEARSLGQRPVVIVWPHAWKADGTLHGNWRERVDAIVQACGDCDYYLADEPYTHSPAWKPKDLDAVAARLPANARVMMSLSRPELDSGAYVPTRVDLLGANLYAGHGVTPSQATNYLDKLASYGRPMYLTLDAWAPLPAQGCLAVTEQTQRASMALNAAMLAWADGRAVRALVSFQFQSHFEQGNDLCGAHTLPLLLESIYDTYRPLLPGAMPTVQRFDGPLVASIGDERYRDSGGVLHLVKAREVPPFGITCDDYALTAGYWQWYANLPLMRCP